MQTLVALLQHHGLLAVFLVTLVESIGLPVPSYPLLIVAAALAPSLDIGLPGLLLAGLLGNLLPDAAWYEAGRRYGTRIMGLLCRLSISPDSCARGSSDLFVRFGAVSLAFIKFIPGFANLGLVLAGAARMRQSVFWTFDALGGVIYIGAGMAIGLVFKNTVAAALNNLSLYGRWGLLAIAGLFAVYLLAKYAQRKWLLHRLRMDRITVDELALLLQREDRPIILDVRPALQREQEGMIPGAIFADPTKLDVVIERPENGREIVVYCACPNEVSAAKLAHRLRRMGFRKIRPLLGGIDAWVKAGHSVDRPDQPPPLALAA